LACFITRAVLWQVAPTPDETSAEEFSSSDSDSDFDDDGEGSPADEDAAYDIMMEPAEEALPLALAAAAAMPVTIAVVSYRRAA
jgi:hypothetical protein